MKATRENIPVDACPSGHPSGSDTIVLESGTTYELSIAGDGDDEGDLDTGGPGANHLFMRGEPGPGHATIDANGIDRVLEVGFGIVVEITDITFTGGNAPPATAGGGGIKNNGTLHLISVDVIGNFTPQFGGGIANRIDDTLIIEDSIITGNTATISGGGVSSAGPLTITASLIAGNTSGQRAGGLASTAEAMIVETTITDNQTLDPVLGSGGGVHNTGEMVIQQSLIANNSAATTGGGIQNSNTEGDQTIALVNTTISGNTAGRGGGISESGDGTTLLNSTIASNQATDPGEADNLISFLAGGAFFEMSNTIISNAATVPAAPRTPIATRPPTRVGTTSHPMTAATSASRAIR